MYRVMIVLAVWFLWAAGWLLVVSATEAKMNRTDATWYGPNFYGNRFACADTPGLPNNYRLQTRGTAHMWLPCGAYVRLCYSETMRCVTVRVIDRGNFGRNNFDVTARTAKDLCGCRRPYTMYAKDGMRWRRGR